MNPTKFMFAAITAAFAPLHMTPSDAKQLEQTVADTEGVEASAVKLITETANYIAAHKEDPVAIQAFADRLNVAKNGLAAAIAANPVPSDDATATGDGSGTGSGTGSGDGSSDESSGT